MKSVILNDYLRYYCTLFATGLMVAVAWLSPVWTNAPEERSDTIVSHVNIIPLK